MGIITSFLLALLMYRPGPCCCTQLPRLPCQRCDTRFACNCSAANLKRVPVVSTMSVLSLDLSFNRITFVTEDDFQEYVHLKVLSLKNNSIYWIKDLAFSSLPNLETLDLSNNKMVELSASWFKNLSFLQHLDLLGNMYRTLGQGFLFRPLGKLRTLKFGNRFLRTVAVDDFAGVRGLEEVVFYGSNLENYEPGSFNQIGAIHQVTLSIAGPFQNNTSLTTNIFTDLSNPKTTLVLADVVLKSENLRQPFLVLKEKGVESFVLRNIRFTNEAVVTMMEIFDGSNLTYIAFEDSSFSGSGYFSGEIPILNHLETIVIGNLEIEEFYQFADLTYLRHLLRTLRRMTIIDSKVFIIPCSTTRLLENVEYLDLSKNLLADLTLREATCNGDQDALQELRVLNVSFNALRNLGIPGHLFTELKKLSTLDLSHNVFRSMPSSCKWPPSLRFLNLSSTQLSQATECLPKSLHVLDLSNNDLTVFDIELPNLTELHISHNKITRLPAGGHYPGLEFLHIHGNALNTFSQKELGDYNNLSTLEAGADTYVCSCEFVALMRDNVEHLVTLRDGYKAYICDFPASERKKPAVSVQLSVFKCHGVAAFSTLCGCILLVLLVSIAMCHKLHATWYLRMTWAWLRAKRRPTVARGDAVARYDAFVSYSERDARWVEEKLVAELEGGQPPLRLCLHQRDFLPGRWIADNIMEAIEQSRRTLFVLTQHFVQSEWCCYELDYSHFRLFDAGNDTTVLVLLEPIAKETIPKRFCKLRKVMNSRTYLEWPEDENERHRFWQSLKDALQRPE